jgi:glucose-6-phosphate 1-dehydrogenase
MDGAALAVDCAGMADARPAEPCILVLFGASGDLASRELIPSLYELHRQKLLPEPFAIVGVSRTEWTDAEYRRRMRESVSDSCTMQDDAWGSFERRLHYAALDAADESDARALSDRISGLCEQHGIPDNMLFHLAVPPAVFTRIVDQLAAVGLASGNGGWRRLVVEKPFGTDEESARALDRKVRSVFAEEAIYRIDHFLGKETVQNMLVFRFANPSFEPVWNRNFIDHVQITVAEDIGIGTRGGFYEATGVVRDMLQNHLLQLLCMVAIEPPVRFDDAGLRDETAKVLEAIRPIDVARDAVRGQYGPGRVRDSAVKGYLEEDAVASDSTTDTFVAVKLWVDNWRWAGVPFYLRTGKRLPRKLTEVAIEFRPTPHVMFPVDASRLHRNRLAFRLQPREGIIQTFAAKQPGPELAICPVTMDFTYDEAFGVDEPPRAYAWLLRDAMQGEQTLFARSDWVVDAWRIVDPIVKAWSEPGSKPPVYAAGTWGPPQAGALIRNDQREWREI